MTEKDNPRRNTWTRRGFVTALAAAGTAAGAGVTPIYAVKNPDGQSRMPICIFSKHLQWLDYNGMAETAAQLGFDGIDLTVRPRGHVSPERVETDLPRAVEAVKAAGLKVHMMTTAITDPQDPRTEAILKTAAGLGIRYYRLGYYRYQDSTDVAKTLEEVKHSLGGLARLNERLGICGDYQNHAGSTSFGAPVWDIWETTRDLDPRWMGCQFDLRHAAVEGGLSWPIEFRLLSSRIHTLAIKDFRWEKMADGWEVSDCPLGQGALDFNQFFELLVKADFAGPVSLHYEYPLGGANGGARELSLGESEVLGAMRSDLSILKGWLKNAGLA